MDQPRPYSIASLAERWTCSSELVRKMIVRGELEGIRYGKLWRIPAAAVARFEAGGRAAANDETTDVAPVRRVDAPAAIRPEKQAPSNDPVYAAATHRLPNWPRVMTEALAAGYLSLGISALRSRGPAPRRVNARNLYDRYELDRWADDLFATPVEDGSR